MGAGYAAASLRVSQQEARNDRVATAIKQEDAKIKEIKDIQDQIKILNERKSVVEGLQNSRNQATRIMEQMGLRLPQGVYLTEIKQSGPKIRLSGVAQNQALVAQTMTQLDNSEWFAEPTLIEIKGVDNASNASTRINSFTVEIKYTNPEDVILPGQVASPQMQIQALQPGSPAMPAAPSALSPASTPAPVPALTPTPAPVPVPVTPLGSTPAKG